MILLSKQNLFDSNFPGAAYDRELRHAMARHAAGEARVIPLILRPVDWQSALFGTLQALPKDGRPVTRWRPQDEAFLDIARGIRSVAEELAHHP
jgi:hypothetical protein